MAGTILKSSCAPQTTEKNQRVYVADPTTKKWLEAYSKTNQLYNNFSQEERKWNERYPDMLVQERIPEVERKLIADKGSTAGMDILKKLAAYQFVQSEAAIYKKKLNDKTNSFSPEKEIKLLREQIDQIGKKTACSRACKIFAASAAITLIAAGSAYYLRQHRFF